MKIIVVSDTHGSFQNFQKVMQLHQNADIVVHCGDSRDELEQIMRAYPDKQYYAVKGNCDIYKDLPGAAEFTAEGVRFYATHGHMYNVKYGLYELSLAAREKQADVVLFGHTHIAADEVDDGIRLFNPGSLGYGKTFGVIEVKDGMVLTNIARLKTGLFS